MDHPIWKLPKSIFESREIEIDVTEPYIKIYIY